MAETTVREARPRMECPDCGRDVSFTTDLRWKYLARHKPGGRRRWCTGRRLEVAA